MTGCDVRNPPYPPCGHLLPSGEKGTVRADGERTDHAAESPCPPRPAVRGEGGRRPGEGSARPVRLVLPLHPPFGQLLPDGEKGTARARSGASRVLAVKRASRRPGITLTEI